MKTPAAFSNVILKLFFLFAFFIVMNEKVNGQRDRVDRTTGKKIHPCQGMSCAANEDEYYGMNMYCLKCLLYTADSTMNAEYDSLIATLTSQKTKLKSLTESQKKWETNTNKAAFKEGEKYKGGTMETTEYLRIKLVLTEKRIIYLRNYKT
jgi:uncharacterized protein YecT (DUF1311 family)